MLKHNLRLVVPFSTNTSDAKNNTLQRIIFKGVHIPNHHSNINTSSNLQDIRNDDDLNNDESISSKDSEEEEMYEHGLDTNQFQFRTNN